MCPSYLQSLPFSTFETIDKKKEKKLKKLKLKLDLAKFVQESMVSGITLQKGKPKELEKFAEFIAKVSILHITPSILYITPSIFVSTIKRRQDSTFMQSDYVTVTSRMIWKFRL